MDIQSILAASGVTKENKETVKSESSDESVLSLTPENTTPVMSAKVLKSDVVGKTLVFGRTAQHQLKKDIYAVLKMRMDSRDLEKSINEIDALFDSYAVLNKD